MKITRVYTRGGDKGMTDLVGGIRIKKTDCRLEAYGTMDELNSHLGLLVAMLGDDNEVRPQLLRIQRCLFNVCTHLAIDQSQTPLYDSARLPEGAVEELERCIDDMNGQLPERLGFILPGGALPAAQCHVCRTVCRRAERRILALAEVATVGDEIIQYVNRLSDYLFVLAKKVNFNRGYEENIWENPCK